MSNARMREWPNSNNFLHLGIALFLNLYLFSAIMIMWNITSYYFETNKNEPFG